MVVTECLLPQSLSSAIGELNYGASNQIYVIMIYLYVLFYLDLLEMSNFCLLVGFRYVKRHKFYTQKEDPGILVNYH